MLYNKSLLLRILSLSLAIIIVHFTSGEKFLEMSSHINSLLSSHSCFNPLVLVEVTQRNKTNRKYIDIYKKRFIIGIGSSGYEGQEVHLQAGKPSKPWCKSVQVQRPEIRELIM